MTSDAPSEHEIVNNASTSDFLTVKAEQNDSKDSSNILSSLQHENSVVPADNNVENGSPRGRKRKLGELERDKKHRRISPPWKKIEAEGPTSFQENGRRKSGRTNALPTTLQPQSKIRQTRAARIKPGEARSIQNLPQSSGYKPQRAAERKLGKPAVEERPKRKYVRRSEQFPALKEETILSRSRKSNANGNKWENSPQSSMRMRHNRRPSWRALDSAGTPTRGYSTKQTVGSAPMTSPNESRVQSLRLNYRRPLTSLPIIHPLNSVSSNLRQHGSLAAFLAHDNPLDGDEEHRLDNEEVLKEALLRDRVAKSIEPGGPLATSNSEGVVGDQSSEPHPGYSHLDYLLPHVRDFAPRLARERKVHAELARKTARYCAVAFESSWRSRLIKAYTNVGERGRRSSTELHAEAVRAEKERAAATRKRYMAAFKKTALREIHSIWSHYATQVRQEKVADYEKKEADLGKRTLNEMLERSTKLLQQRIQGSEDVEDEEPGTDNEQDLVETDLSGDDSSLSDRGSRGDEDIDGSDSGETSSDDESEENAPADGLIPDDKLTLEELKARYANIDSISSPGIEGRAPNPFDVAEGSEWDDELTADIVEFKNPLSESDKLIGLDDSSLTAEQLRQKYAMLNNMSLDEALAGVESALESDESGSDSGTTDEEEEEVPHNDESSEESDDGYDMSTSLLGFFKAEDISAMETPAPRALVAQPEDDELAIKTPPNGVKHEQTPSQLPDEETVLHGRKMHEINLNSASDNSAQMTPTTDFAAASSSKSSVDASEPAFRHTVVEGRDLSLKTPLPHLLRGTLRQYQHYGLDWMAGMYMSGTNGILADEMGLGKTIQTIALLAHLATEHQIWGPHLIIVPTSVMLNWEMEFKKWCPGFKILTYYGTQEERKQKRQGWLDHDKWNVCITSYQLALQDAYSLKRKPWYYMVLDEAHHIKNFQSQRWQTLLGFPTDRRLLLTGTPLQNNLTELWSLLCFISHDEHKFQDLQDFTRAFRVPAEQILDQGRDSMDEEAWATVKKLHQVLRPHLLRRLKSEVEKQMPKKYEHIVRCRLSKRQRQLYDGYMGLGGTKDSFASGNYMSIIKCLMQLRKVCNHPDLFETRQIVTSFAMPRSVVADFEIKDLLIRKRFIQEEDNNIANSMMLSLWDKNCSTLDGVRGGQLSALPQLSKAVKGLSQRIGAYAEGLSGVELSINRLGNTLAQSRRRHLHQQIHLTHIRTTRRPMYSTTFLEAIAVDQLWSTPSAPVSGRPNATQLYLNSSELISSAVKSTLERSTTLQPIIQKFSCVTPNVVASDVSGHALTAQGLRVVQEVAANTYEDPFHESRIRLSIAFPDKGLIQYDCGKLQQLDRLLRQLEAGGHRALIFTQMTKVLDILEQFLNLHGHLYLRLDGSTKIEQRQILTERFNNDSRILAFILSSRSGGLGLNLTGADTVIFYDLDWNPAMDKQCQDRCHRIGQTRDVHIYRFVSEGTIEANILRKSNQKRMLDDVVIQEGEFTTDYFNRMEHKDLLQDNPADAETDAALDMVFGGDRRVREDAEDKEDRDAAKVAEKEVVQNNAADFDETLRGDASSATPATPAPMTPIDAQVDTPDPEVEQAEQANGVADSEDVQKEVGDLQDYFLRFMRYEYKDLVIAPPSARFKKKAKKGKDYTGLRIRR